MQRLAEIRAALSAHGLRPSKRMGQNFLVDTNMLHAIARDADVDAGDCVLEIADVVAAHGARCAGSVARLDDQREADLRRERADLCCAARAGRLRARHTGFA